jgi:hypothetical protein
MFDGRPESDEDRDERFILILALVSCGILWLVYRAIRGIVRGIGRRSDEQRDLDILDAAIERGRLYDVHAFLQDAAIHPKHGGPS